MEKRPEEVFGTASEAANCDLDDERSLGNATAEQLVRPLDDAILFLFC